MDQTETTIRRKIIAKFPTLLEAEAAVTALEASGIYAIVNNEITGGMMPHASDALGGFQVSVDVDKENEARALLEGAVLEEPVAPAEPASLSRQVDQQMKRATYGAVMGCIILPVIANLFSVSLYAKAYRTSPAEFWRHPWLVALGVFFNLLGLALAVVMASAIYGEFARNQAAPAAYESSSHRSAEPESAPTSSREDRDLCFAAEADDQKRIEACNAVIAREKNRRLRAGAFLYMGIAYDRQGRSESAIREFGHVLDIYPDSGDAFLQRGYTRAKLGDYPSALDDYDKAVEFEPRASMARGHRCFLLLQLKRHQEAMKDCDAAVELANGDDERARDHRAGALEIRGMLRLEMGQAKEALGDFHAALALRPDQTESRYGRGLAKQKLGDAKGAELDLAAALKDEPGVALSYGTYSQH